MLASFFGGMLVMIVVREAWDYYRGTRQQGPPALPP